MSEETDDTAVDKGRTMKEVSEELRHTHQKDMGEDERPAPPEPKKLTPEQMAQSPDELLEPSDEQETDLESEEESDAHGFT